MEELKGQNVLVTPNNTARKRSVNQISKNIRQRIIQNKLTKKIFPVKNLLQPQASKFQVRNKENK